jgi:hypothetical protein
VYIIAGFFGRKATLLHVALLADAEKSAGLAESVERQWVRLRPVSYRSKKRSWDETRTRLQEDL